MRGTAVRPRWSTITASAPQPAGGEPGRGRFDPGAEQHSARVQAAAVAQLERRFTGARTGSANSCGQTHVHPVRAVKAGDPPSQRGRERPLEGPLGGLDHRHLAAERARTRGNLHADQPGADDRGRPLPLAQGQAQAKGVFVGTQLVYPAARRDALEPPGPAAGCDHKALEAKRAGAAPPFSHGDPAPAGVELARAHAEQQLDLVLVVPLVAAKLARTRLLDGGEDRLRQRWTVVRAQGLLADDPDAARESLPAQRLAAALRGEAAPGDQHIEMPRPHVLGSSASVRARRAGAGGVAPGPPDGAPARAPAIGRVRPRAPVSPRLRRGPANVRRTSR